MQTRWLIPFLSLPFFAGLSASAADAPQATLDAKHRVFLEENCTKCHNGKKQKGQLRLDDISFTLDSVEIADRWQKILNEINSGEMPPEDSDQPERVAKTEFLDSLSHTLMAARRTLGDSGGKITMRRLNRREYKNTIRDLLGVDINVRGLPADGGAGTSDTVGSSLFMSSDQFEQYLTLGRLALDEHFARTGPVFQPLKMRVEPEGFANKEVRGRAEVLRKNYQRYQQWTAGVDAAALLPQHAALTKSLRGRAEVKANPLNFYRLWSGQVQEPSPAKFGFKDFDDANFANTQFSGHHRYYTDYLALPVKDSGAYLTIYEVHQIECIQAPSSWPVGTYTLRVRIAALDDAPEGRRFMEIGQRDASSGDFTVMGSHHITGTMAHPQVIDIPVTLTTTGKREFTLREKVPNDRHAQYSIWKDALTRTGTGPKPALWIDWIELENTSAPTLAATKTIKERREVELHANAMVGGTYNGYFKGGYEAAKQFLATGQPQNGIPDEAEAKFRVLSYEQHGPSYERYLNDPLTRTGAFLTLFNVHKEEVITLPPDQPSGWMKTKHEVEKAGPGDYLLRFRIGTMKGTPGERHFVALGSRAAGEEDFTLMQTFQISGTADAPQTIEVPVHISADGPRTFVLRERRDVKLDHVIYTAAQKATGMGPPSALWIDWVEWEGPLNTPAQTSTSSLLIASTKDSAGAREVIERFARRAFRDKAAKPDYIDKLMKLFDTRLKAGDEFDTALKAPLSVVLSSPRFLYLSEPADEKKPRPLTASELATRLSYFLWSAPPDDTLLAFTRSGGLMKPGALAREVDRMIASGKADEFVSGFVHQWLGMDRLDFFQFDTTQFPDFDESAKAAARREVYETFAHLLRTNGSASDLLKCDYVIVNGLLADYYGIDGVSGDEFRKVPLPKRSPRGGLLGMAAIMAMGSNGEHSSPVERGVWVLKHLLNDSPPPAPPNVPQITRLGSQPLTTRERLLAHQEEPQCASCHRSIDPIGFGLENFNAVGKWRTEDSFQAVDANGRPTKNGLKTWTIDPAAAFYKGPAFKDFFELRDLIAARPGDFARGLTQSLIQYALGRPFGFTDDDLATTIVQRAQKKGFTLREFIVALVGSKEFQTK